MKNIFSKMKEIIDSCEKRYYDDPDIYDKIHHVNEGLIFDAILQICTKLNVDTPEFLALISTLIIYIEDHSELNREQILEIIKKTLEVSKKYRNI